MLRYIADGRAELADPVRGMVSYNLQDFAKFWTGVFLTIIPKDVTTIPQTYPLKSLPSSVIVERSDLLRHILYLDPLQSIAFH